MRPETNENAQKGQDDSDGEKTRAQIALRSCTNGAGLFGLYYEANQKKKKMVLLSNDCPSARYTRAGEN